MDAFERVTDALRHHARTRGDATALRMGAQRLSHAGLEAAARRVANGLLAVGINAGERVAVLAGDSIATYEILLGCAKAGAVFTPINWRLAAPEILHILEDSQTRLLFVDHSWAARLPDLNARLSRTLQVILMDGTGDGLPTYEAWRDAQGHSEPVRHISPEAPLVQIYTSGTTGRPKGVQLAHYSFLRLLQGMRAQGDHWMDLCPEDRLLLSLPSFHIGGLWWALQGLIAGGCGVVMETFAAWKALELIREERITQLILVPAMIQFVLAEPECEQADFSQLRGLVYGGSPIAPALLRRAMLTFGCDFYQIYGLTETGNTAVCLRPADHRGASDQRLRAAGRPYPGVELKIIDRDGQSLPSGQVGEVCIKSPSNMLGYWNRPEATAETLVDGWVHTGDAGHLDDEGLLTVCDRIKDMIIYAGENIFPVEIEAALSEHPAVAECAVIGIPDQRWGETIKAFVVTRPGLTIKSRELHAFLRGRIADFKLPKSIEFVTSLPRNPSGKLLKRELRAPYWQGQECMIG